MIKSEDIKKILTLDDIIKITLSLGATIKKETNKEYIFTSICHHKDAENHSPKLYLYKSSKSFYCYSCSSSFDIFGLIQQRQKILGENSTFPYAIKYVCDMCHIDSGDIQITTKSNICNWQEDYNKYINYKNIKHKGKIYDKSILNMLEDKYYQGWIDENISVETMEKFGIKWYQYKQQIIIPVFSEQGDFVGLHARNLNPEAIEKGYKYMPMESLTQDYRFDTSSVLYGLNVNKENIRNNKTVILFESPKSVLQMEDILDENISVALFGMNLQRERVKMLVQYADHFIIALDKQYHQMYKDGVYCDENGNEVKVYTEEFKTYIKIINRIIKLLKPYGTIDLILDKEELLDYKDSPSDKGKEIWEKLWKEKINVN